MSELMIISDSTSTKNIMSYEILLELMADIEVNKRSDPRAVITLLKILKSSELELKII